MTFIGGHPLAGSARGGLEASRVDLFERRPWLLTPDGATPAPAVERLANFVRALGATPVVVDPVMHDHVLAYTSHLPQLTASALMHVVGESVGEPGLRLSGSGLADTTRVAASPAPIWSDICATNADEVLPALDKLIATLQALRGQLGQGQSIAPLFESAQRWRARVKTNRRRAVHLIGTSSWSSDLLWSSPPELLNLLWAIHNRAWTKSCVRRRTPSRRFPMGPR